MKNKFYRDFNRIFHRVSKLKNEMITVQLMNSFCKPYLLYGSECLGLSMMEMRGFRNSWQCSISHVFNISGDSVNSICSMIDELPLDLYISNRRLKFLQNLLCHFNGHVVLSTAFRYIGSQEFLFRTILHHNDLSCF